MADWKKNIQTPIRMRVFNVLRHWIEGHFYDFESDVQLTANFQSFLDTVVKTESVSYYKQLVKTFTNTQYRKKSTANLVMPTKPPKPLLTKKIAGGKFGVLDIPPLELARQWALIDHQHLSSIEAF